MTSARRGWMWSAVASCGWAALLVQLVTIEWTPDCGGVSYGAPLPFATSWMGSSQEFDLYVGAFFVDLLGYAILLALPLWGLARSIAGLRGWGRRLSFCIVLLPCIVAPLLGASLMAFGVQPVSWPREHLYVREWRTKRLFLGPPNWATHLEDACN